MCAILFCKNDKISESEFVKALELMMFRGPDVHGCRFIKNNCYLGHNRLKIIGINDASNQPFKSEDGRHVIIFNGEIYNYRELALQYSINLATQSDTELLIKLYIKYGSQMVSWLNGIFTFVIYDTYTNNYFIARDRLGVKPLYIYDKNDTFIISSEIAPIIYLTKTKKIDEIGLRQYKKLRTFYNNHTLYADIKFFPAAHYYSGEHFFRYWEFPNISQDSPEDEELRYLIESSVNYRCVADVEVGSFLSGGIDSTIVAKLCSKPHTWTIGSPTNNEFKYARIAAQKFDTIHHEVNFDESEFIPLATSMIKKRCEPLSVPNEVLLYKMSLAVKTKNTVVLSGEGADELFFGYDRIFRWAQGIKEWDIKGFDKYYSYGTHEDFEILDYVIEPFKQYGSPINMLAAFFQISHLHGLLRRLDYASMLAAVEAREPFVDYRLIEKMAGVSFNYRMKDEIVKAPLKRIFADIIPQEIIDREKIGFPVSIDKIFNNRINAYDSWLTFNLETLDIE
jgi:asparagine synthase (glutamine-hydrolysing)